MNNQKNKRIIISGGGSGGHIFPAIAIANELKKIDSTIELLFVGAKGKMEMEKVPKAGYPIEGLWISGFQRKLSFQNLIFPFKLISSIWKASRILRSFKPDVVIGVGGYASGPTLEMASRMGIPTLIQEQNSYAGITNRLLAKKVNTICVGYDGMEKTFPKDKIVLVGNPIRQDIASMSVSKEEAVAHFGFDINRPIIVIIGGSLGARTFNQAMRDNTDFLKENNSVQVLWQMGKLYEEEYANCETANLPNVKATTFIDRMDLAYTMADVVIGRAGALTISELCLVGKPTILIPSPNVSEDHQTYNAKALVEKEAAILVKDADAKGKMLPTALELLADKKRQLALASNIKQLAKPNATANIVKEIFKLMPDSK